MSLQVAPALVGPEGQSLTRSEYPAEFVVPNVEVVGPRLLVLPAINVEYTTSSGLVIPAHAQEKQAKGIVLLNGDGVMLENGSRIEPRVEVGWEILFARYAGVELEFSGVQYLIIQESDVRAIFKMRGNILKRIREHMESRTEGEDQVD